MQFERRKGGEEREIERERMLKISFRFSASAPLTGAAQHDLPSRGTH